MSVPRELVLYSTDGCTLCEEVLALLLSLPQARGYRLTVTDIALDDALVARYGARIPVLACGGRELEAPIAAADLARWLSPT